MNKFIKITIGVGCAVQAATAAAVAVRYASTKKAIHNGKVEGWIREVVGQEINVVFDNTIGGPAKLADDKSTVFFRLSDSDVFELAMGYRVSVKTIIQTAAAHEMGHYVDPRLEELNNKIEAACDNLDYDTYVNAMMERETRAWQLGKKYAPNKKIYNDINKGNLRKYKYLLNEDKVRFELEASTRQLNQSLAWFSGI